MQSATMDQGIESGLGEGKRPVDGYPGRLDGLESPLSSVIPAPGSEGGEPASPPSFANRLDTSAQPQDASPERYSEATPTIMVWAEDAGIDDSGISSSQMDTSPSE